MPFDSIFSKPRKPQPLGPPEDPQQLQGLGVPEGIGGVGANPAFGFNQWERPGYFSNIFRRDAEREGLPGMSPEIDPRLVDPKNSGLESNQQLQRDDIDLDTGHEGVSRLLKLYDTLNKYKLGR